MALGYIDWVSAVAVGSKSAGEADVTVTKMPLSSHVEKCVVRGMCNCSKALDKEPQKREKKEGGGKEGKRKASD